MSGLTPEGRNLVAWMGPEDNTNIDWDRCSSWIEETAGGWIVAVDLVSHSREVRTVGSRPFLTQMEAECFQLHLQGLEA